MTAVFTWIGAATLVLIAFFALVGVASWFGRWQKRRPDAAEQDDAPWLPRHRFGPDGPGVSRPPVAPYLGQPDLHPRSRGTWHDDEPEHRHRSWSDVKAERAGRDTGKDAPPENPAT